MHTAEEIFNITLREKTGPYDRVVSPEQIQQAVDSGLTPHEIEDRLVDAECLVCTMSTDINAYGLGWFAACDKIASIPVLLENDDDDDELRIGDLHEQALDYYHGLKRACYADHLSGLEWNGLVKLSGWSGRVDALNCGCFYIAELNNDIAYKDLAAILKKNPDTRHFDALIRKKRAADLDQKIKDAAARLMAEADSAMSEQAQHVVINGKSVFYTLKDVLKFAPKTPNEGEVQS